MQMQLQCTLQIMREDRVFFDFELIFTFLYAGRQQYQKCERAIRLVYPPLSCELPSLSNATKISNGVRSVDSNSPVFLSIHNYTHVHMNLFSYNDRYYHFPKY